MKTLTMDEVLVTETVKKLRVLYSHYYDGCDFDNLAGLFSEDAICEFPEEYGGSWVGRDAIKANFKEQSHLPIYSVLHSVTNPWIEIKSPTIANGRWYLHDLRTTEGEENPLILYGIYDDIYKKIGDEWFIHRTRIDFLWRERKFFGFRTEEELQG